MIGVENIGSVSMWLGIYASGEVASESERGDRQQNGKS
jgi:hypothetical protein